MIHPTEAELCIESTLESSHFLPHVEDTHRCRKAHGHSFLVKIFVLGVVTPDHVAFPDSGMVMDYDVVLRSWQILHGQLDHTTLNLVPGLENPTCENISLWILQRMPAFVTSISVGTGLVGGLRASATVRRSGP